MRTLLPFLLFACTAPPPLPNAPPPDRAPRTEGLNAVAECAGSHSADPRIAVAASASEAETGGSLHFSVRNVSAEHILISAFSLPWENPNAVQLSAVTDGGELLTVGWPISERGPEQFVTLSPGQAVSGDLILRYRVVDIEAARANNSVLISWCFPLRLHGEDRAGATTGVVTLVKRGI